MTNALRFISPENPSVSDTDTPLRLGSGKDENEVCVSSAAMDNKAHQTLGGGSRLSSLPRAQASNKRMSSTVVTNEQNTPNAESAVDHKLVVRVQQGDKAAFDLLVLKYQSRVASIISRYVGDRHEIADVAQETFIKAFRAINNFRADSAFYTWLYRIAVNTSKNYLISKGRKTPSIDIDVSDAEHVYVGQGLEDLSNPADQLSRDQLEVIVFSTIKALPEDLRMALSLREFEGLSYDEISSVMDCPVGTVRSRIFRAREAVDAAIQKAQGAD